MTKAKVKSKPKTSKSPTAAGIVASLEFLADHIGILYGKIAQLEQDSNAHKTAIFTVAKHVQELRVQSKSKARKR